MHLLLYVMALFYIAAGINHFRSPAFYLNMMPVWIPAHRLAVAASGVAEMVLGAALFFPELRVYAAWGVVAMLVAFIPVHIYMLMDREKFADVPRWMLIARLPLQLVLIAWAGAYT